MLKYSLLFTLLAAVLISSCISSANITDEKRFGILFEADKVGEDLTIGDQAVNISEFKFALGSLTLTTEDDIAFETVERITALIFAYTEELIQERLIIEVGLGINNDLAFNRYTMFLEPVEDRSSIFDDDFFGADENYSVIIKGTIGEEEFEFKSSAVFDKEFSFNRVEVDAMNETLVLRKTIDLEDLFTDSNGDFIDPRVSQNEVPLINSVQENLQLSVTAEDLY
ncbi:hypothetical protein [Rhodohalobacter mucosus]|uniref:Uncharacterized protein n=1 Tax=Rhodohalobacter mucosus TaxID=2079485 RepID=A0A316TSM6_9BACT|nr:hypothetical protein [Rhodohalobacter mucosus]PWN05242.1 hypothetical protein DDZ15_14260 [Rhodohalobacter mucosus]